MSLFTMNYEELEIAGGLHAIQLHLSDKDDLLDTSDGDEIAPSGRETRVDKSDEPESIKAQRIKNESSNKLFKTRKTKDDRAKETTTNKATSVIEAVMGTNDSCTVSKRSVEKIYYESPHFYRHFVRKPKSRAPLINRGYWLRMQIIERSLRSFLLETKGSHRIVINLGCGFDALPFRMLARHRELCERTTFVDVDYDALLRNKVDIIKTTEQLRLLLDGVEESPTPDQFLLKSRNYAALACDLRDIEQLDKVIRGAFNPDATILVICEVSITYMDPQDANAILKWASSLGNVRFHLLEQCLPNGTNHPFATTMLNHFNKLQSALRVVEKYPLIDDQIQRFEAVGWQSVSAKSLWALWNDSTYFDITERRELNTIEMFDEWEEFVLFSSHYFFLVAKTTSKPSETSDSCMETTDINHAGYQDLLLERCRSDQADCPPRRFAVLYQSGERAFDFYGGEDATRRVSTTRTFSLPPYTGLSRLCDIPDAKVRAFHSVTPLIKRFDCLITGGRDGPDKPLSDTWLRRDGQWRKVDDIPIPIYRHATTLVKDETDHEGVLLFGGRTRQGLPSSAWYLWQELSGWRELECKNENLTPRFGAIIITSDGKNTGLLLGGMSDDGKVLDECYRWTIWTGGDERRITVEGCLGESKCATSLCRVGASLVNSPLGLHLVGGVQSSGLPPPGHEVYRLRFSLKPQHENPQLMGSPISIPWYQNKTAPQPLLVGHSAIYDGEGVVVIGGGATCFSFGKHMNANIWKFDNQGQRGMEAWRCVQLGSASTGVDRGLKKQDLFAVIPSPRPTRSRAESSQDQKITLSDATRFPETISEGTPAVFASLDLGPCVTKWTTEYLKETIGPTRQLEVHHAQESTMLFENKNFVIRKNTASEFMDAIANGERRYLRSVSSMNRHKPANFSQDFESLNADFVLPETLAIPPSKIHSSVLRISGPINMWLHYDVMPNVLCQIRGRKRLVLFPPEDVGNVQIPPGRSSSNLNVFDPEARKNLPLSLTHPREAILTPGDVLFIPAFWCHAALPLDGVSVAINTFFKALDSNFYAPGKDTYGNKDRPEYEYSRRDIAKAISRFESMPRDMSRFYLERLAHEMLEKARDT